MVRIWCQKVAWRSMPVQYAGNGWLLVGDALRSCVNTGISVRGMDMALTGAHGGTNADKRLASTASRKICFRFIITT